MSDSTLQSMVRSLDPHLHDGVYVFGSLPADTSLDRVSALGVFHEAEAVTVIVAEPEAARIGLECKFRAAWITLRVSSALDSVGLTAAVARALAEVGISCNIVAAVNHDHLFVPVEQAGQAMDALRALQRAALSATEE